MEGISCPSCSFSSPTTASCLAHAVSGLSSGTNAKKKTTRKEEEEEKDVAFAD
jgi:hypothetical protein